MAWNNFEWALVEIFECFEKEKKGEGGRGRRKGFHIEIKIYIFLEKVVVCVFFFSPNISFVHFKSYFYNQLMISTS